MGLDEDRAAVVRREHVDGGDPTCRLSRLCPECGLLPDGEPPAVCPRCGADMPADDGGAP
ncbi:hypothetical protein [Saccharothrix syringae]|uniref:Uncharacterized protein n=1 Tax=Saccharothrix syringae TaxID=103733 RepID=A0A5Q0H1W6_SACSY|nr:hypothetical protein [Saccharothrix syringae]QFZ19895.1 hypothetical protein EKG83_22885 [Saccharothrix syringae]